MAHPKETPFTAWNFTVEEELQSKLIPPLLRMQIQNRITELATMRLNIEVDPADISKFVQTEASLKGAITELQGLLVDDTLTQEKIRQISAGNLPE